MKTAQEIYSENGFTNDMVLPNHLVTMLMQKFSDQAMQEKTDRIKELEEALGELRDFYTKFTGLPASRANGLLSKEKK